MRKNPGEEARCGCSFIGFAHLKHSLLNRNKLGYQRIYIGLQNLISHSLISHARKLEGRNNFPFLRCIVKFTISTEVKNALIRIF